MLTVNTHMHGLGWSSTAIRIAVPRAVHAGSLHDSLSVDCLNERGTTTDQRSDFDFDFDFDSRTGFPCRGLTDPPSGIQEGQGNGSFLRRRGNQSRRNRVFGERRGRPSGLEIQGASGRPSITSHQSETGRSEVRSRKCSAEKTTTTHGPGAESASVLPSGP